LQKSAQRLVLRDRRQTPHRVESANNVPKRLISFSHIQADLRICLLQMPRWAQSTKAAFAWTAKTTASSAEIPAMHRLFPHEPDHSKIIQLVRGDDPNSVMPPKGGFRAGQKGRAIFA